MTGHTPPQPSPRHGANHVGLAVPELSYHQTNAHIHRGVKSKARRTRDDPPFRTRAVLTKQRSKRSKNGNQADVLAVCETNSKGAGQLFEKFETPLPPAGLSQRAWRPTRIKMAVGGNRGRHASTPSPCTGPSLKSVAEKKRTARFIAKCQRLPVCP